jgi:ketosteroid isomerase-like protein
MDELIRLEREGWNALSDGTAVDYYAALLTDDALFVVPGMVLDRAQTLASWEGVDPWRDYTFRDTRVLPLGDDAALLTYAASATRADGSEYAAQFTSVYVRVDGAWKLTFHQQT